MVAFCGLSEKLTTPVTFLVYDDNQLDIVPLPLVCPTVRTKTHRRLLPSRRRIAFKSVDYLLLVGYTVIAINHVVQSKFQGGALPDFALRKREGVIILKRLTIIIDEAGEKGCGLVRSVAIS